MTNLWTTLTPLILGSALVPIQIIITILLLRSSAGKRAAIAWVAGMTAVRVAQGVVFGLIMSSSGTTEDTVGGASPIVSTVLLILGVMFLVTAARQLLAGDDPDAPPPKWLTAAETMSPAKAFGLGSALLVIGAKFWVFTLGAITAIGDADLSRGAGIATFIAFVVLAELAHLAVIGISFVAPRKSDAILQRGIAVAHESQPDDRGGARCRVRPLVPDQGVERVRRVLRCLRRRGCARSRRAVNSAD